MYLTTNGMEYNTLNSGAIVDSGLGRVEGSGSGPIYAAIAALEYPR
jgi:hypothetical protein